MQPHSTTDRNSIPGIYLITCTMNKKIYIGSAVHLSRRWNSHRHQLRHNIHRNPILQHAWNKYGESAFTFEILELVLLPEMLTAREQYWFNKLKPFGRKGFNLVPTAGSNLGMKCREETRRKLSEAGKDRKHRPESIEKTRLAHLGTKRSPETRANISAAKYGKPSPHRGKKHSPEQNERQSQAMLGKPGRRLGKKTSPEALARVIAVRRLRMKSFIVTSPDGTEYSVIGIQAFCKEHHLDSSALTRVAQGKQIQHKGWKARFLD